MERFVRSLGHPAFAFALAGLGACFVEPPPIMHDSDTDPCAMEGTSCTCMSGGCETSTSTAESGDGATTGSEPDTTASSEGPHLESTGTASSEGGESSSDDGVVDTSDSSGDAGTTGPDESCPALACADCLSCVDAEGQPCAAAYAACDEVIGCGPAVTCLVNCGLGIDCLENCCEGLDAQQLAVVDELVSCKSEECIEPCDMVAELEGCA